MKIRFLLLILITFFGSTLWAQRDEGRYIEVTGTSEIEIIPDEIHYIIEIKEYFEEEFDGKSKPEEYRTKVLLPQIEKELRTTLYRIGISESAIRTQEIAGDYQRMQGRDYLVGKLFDITLENFDQIDKIIKVVDTKGIHLMRIGELKNKDMQTYRQKGKIEALKAARNKAAYLVEALGKNLGEVIRITEPRDEVGFPRLLGAQSNVCFSDAGSFEVYRTIKLNYSMSVRFEIVD